MAFFRRKALGFAWGPLFMLLCLSCGDFFVDPQLTSIAVNPSSPSLVMGDRVQFNAVGTYDDGTTKVLSNPVWTSSDSAIVLVGDAGAATALAEGSATVSATSGVASGSTSISVLGSPLVSLALSPLNPTVNLGNQSTQQFSSTGTFGDGTVHDISSAVTWDSSDTAVASISSTGLAALIKAGITTIQSTSGSVTAATTLTVTGSAGGGSAISPNSMAITPASGTLSLAGRRSQQFTATGSFSGNEARDITREARWSSSDPTVATVADTGLATATGRVGSTTISATMGTQSAFSLLTVTP